MDKKICDFCGKEIDQGRDNYFLVSLLNVRGNIWEIEKDLCNDCYKEGVVIKLKEAK